MCKRDGLDFRCTTRLNLSVDLAVQEDDFSKTSNDSSFSIDQLRRNYKWLKHARYKLLLDGSHFSTCKVTKPEATSAGARALAFKIVFVHLDVNLTRPKQDDLSV